VPEYRIYEIDGAGRFSTADWIQADGDDAALAAARKGNRSASCEVWQAGRLVGRIERPPDED
jgi:hypothetical protein